MKIFRLGSIERSEVLTTRSESKSRLLYPFGLAACPIDPVHLKRVHGTGSSRLTDIMYVGSPHPWVLSQRCIDSLGDVLARDGVLYNAVIRGVKRPYFLFSPSQIVDCLDQSRSIISSTAFVKFLKHACFKDCDLSGVDLFVAKGFEASAMFVTERFRESFVRAGLVGARFDDG